MRRKRCWPEALLALALLAGACTEDGAVTGEGLEDTELEEPFRTPSASPTPTRAPSSRPPAPPTHGLLRIVVQDQDDLEGRSRVRVHYSGPRSGSLLSGRDGVAAVRVPAGRYRVEVRAGCQDRVEVFRGSSGTAGVFASDDDPSLARLTIQGRRRFWGGTPIQHDTPVPWPAGKVVTLRYRLYDRCRDVEAPRTAIDDVRYRAGGNLELAGSAARVSDAASDVTLRVRCTGAGDASLTIFDPDNPDDELDLLTLRPPSIEPSETWCGS